MVLTYGIIAAILLIAELVYFKIADHFNIIDKPNERSSHSNIVLRGGGIIFPIGVWIWCFWQMVQGEWFMVQEYWPFILAVTMAAVVSFVDDIHPLSDSVRLATQFVAMLLVFYQIGLLQPELWWLAIPGILLCVGAVNLINFTDGINGMISMEAIACMVPYIVVVRQLQCMDESLLWVAILSVLVFAFFNFRPKGKAKCFAGDVGSVSMAFMLLFPIGTMIMATMDITYLTFLVVYGVEGCLTIVHRIMLHENLGEAHRKHAYEIMANELQMGHVKVASLYAGLQLAFSLGMLALPEGIVWHWVYILSVGAVLIPGYVLFMKKYYHLHEEYLASLKGGE